MYKLFKPGQKAELPGIYGIFWYYEQAFDAAYEAKMPHAYTDPDKQKSFDKYMDNILTERIPQKWGLTAKEAREKYDALK